MSWSQFLDQTYTLAPSPLVDSLIQVDGLTRRQVAIRASSPSARPSWRLAARLTFEQEIPEIESEPSTFTAETPPLRIELERNSLIEVPLTLTPPYRAFFRVPYWFTELRLEIWQAPLLLAPLPGEFKDLAFNVGSSGWTDDNGYYWIVAAGGTIGNSGSSATFKGLHLERLYKALWPHYPVVSKGSSASSDWNAGKALTLPDLRGRTRITAGQGSGLTNRAIAQTLGAETHSLTTAEMPSHNHPGASGAGAFFMSPGSGGSFTVSTLAGSQHRTASNTGNAGSGQPHNNMQPSFVACTVIATGERYNP
ncbi:hypothetical protein HJG54_19680 [Leptolyngbya sp. NK1-12]|uniref:Phage tail protein n=1 Tax=Leptolyngbya sp. NK1-12 TaxID=2547451 RepID=A0AA96WGV6_9CYAN|nr:hypothetical protein [Leptolyngbya sp. NK1-12]WNZ24849.1 hypothetical protein HJG54_19680 [Leptolyngbya sp. NK1-12]